MAGETTSHIREFFDEGRASDRALVVLNRTEPRPLVNLLSEAFDGQDVDVAEREEDDEETDLVALVEGDSVVATSPLQALSDAFLMVNSDLYRTGTRTLDEFDAPAVLTELDDTVFSLRGFPASTKEKLLLILISRYIEKQALDADTGTLRSSFQKLSRLNDEAGTREIYERLGGSSVDVHVYGIGDWTPSDAPYAIHTGEEDEYRHTWFVVHDPGRESAPHAALVAYETEPNVWKGMWTHRPALVDRIDRYVASSL
ncbi:DICT sensory domain-containing protein [Haloarculaceae archaeon H-GB2-1]|nr:histidine kinase [Haloarculaceae archaeon H-GB1-1]MEA5407172.1 DICT sensory domain-containing protein [Haloarculaceae archaeon H-GB2-1]